MTVAIRGANNLGDHVTGTVKLVLPLGDESANGSVASDEAGEGRS